MTDEQKPNPVETPEKFYEQDLPRPDQRSTDRLTYLLSSLERGWKVVVLREQPTWCRGHLETIEYFGDDDEPIDIDYLIRMWGGRKLHLKIHNERGQWIGGGSISLYSYPPKVRGKIIKEEEFYGSIPGPQASMTPAMIPHQIQAPNLDISKILDLVSKQKGADLGSMLKLLEYAQGRPAVQQQNPLEQMLGMAQIFRQFKDVFSDFGGSTSTDSDDMTPIFGEIVKALVQKKDKPSSRGALAPPKLPRKSLPMPAANPQESTGKSDSKRDEKETITQIARKMSDLEPEDAAGVVFLALDGMPPDKRQAAMQTFLSNMSGDFLDEYDLEDDTIDQDEKD